MRGGGGEKKREGKGDGNDGGVCKCSDIAKKCIRLFLSFVRMLLLFSFV